MEHEKRVNVVSSGSFVTTDRKVYINCLSPLKNKGSSSSLSPPSYSYVYPKCVSKIPNMPSKDNISEVEIYSGVLYSLRT